MGIFEVMCWVSKASKSRIALLELVFIRGSDWLHESRIKIFASKVERHQYNLTTSSFATDQVAQNVRRRRPRYQAIQVCHRYIVAAGVRDSQLTSIAGTFRARLGSLLPAIRRDFQLLNNCNTGFDARFPNQNQYDQPSRRFRGC